MIETIVVSVALIVCTYLLTKADMKFTVTHKHVYPEIQQDDVNALQEALDKTEEESDVPTQLQLIQAFQEIIGGELDERG